MQYIYLHRCWAIKKLATVIYGNCLLRSWVYCVHSTRIGAVRVCGFWHGCWRHYRMLTVRTGSWWVGDSRHAWLATGFWKMRRLMVRGARASTSLLQLASHLLILHPPRELGVVARTIMSLISSLAFIHDLAWDDWRCPFSSAYLHVRHVSASTGPLKYGAAAKKSKN